MIFGNFVLSDGLKYLCNSIDRATCPSTIPPNHCGIPLGLQLLLNRCLGDANIQDYHILWKSEISCNSMYAIIRKIPIVYQVFGSPVQIFKRGDFVVKPMFAMHWWYSTSCRIGPIFFEKSSLHARLTISFDIRHIGFCKPHFSRQIRYGSITYGVHNNPFVSSDFRRLRLPTLYRSSEAEKGPGKVIFSRGIARNDIKDIWEG